MPKAFRVLTDAVLLNIAVVVAYFLRCVWAILYNEFEGSYTDLEVMELYTDSYLRICWVITLSTLISFSLSGFYASGGAYQSRLKIVLVTQAVTVGFAVTGLLAYLTEGIVAAPRSVLVLAWIMALILFWSSRMWSAAWRYMLREEVGESASSSSDGKHTALVIGGGGYIGSALVPKLLANGYRVRVMDLFLYGTGPIERVLDHPDLEIMRADFRQVDALVKAMRGVDHVFHLGGIVGDPACAFDEQLTIDVNLTATRVIAQVAKGNGIKHFVFASTCSVYGASDELLNENSRLNPLSLYARTKAASESVLLDMADDSFTPLIVRFATIYGLSGRIRFDLVVNLLTAKALFDGQITVHGGDQWRPFLHVDDAASALLQVLRIPAGRGVEIFNVGSNQENYTINQVAAIIKQLCPTAELVCARDSQDKRNYRVKFGKIQIMTGFRTQWTVEKGVRQVIDAIQLGQVTDYSEAQYSNEKYLSETQGSGLARPQFEWAQRLVGQSFARPANESSSHGQKIELVGP